jgi:hypothetical protein
MEMGDTFALAMIGLVVVGLFYLANEVQRMRESIEPLASSPLVQALSRAGQ